MGDVFGVSKRTTTTVWISLAVVTVILAIILFHVLFGVIHTTRSRFQLDINADEVYRIEVHWAYDLEDSREIINRNEIRDIINMLNGYLLTSRGMRGRDTSNISATYGLWLFCENGEEMLAILPSNSMEIIGLADYDDNDWRIYRLLIEWEEYEVIRGQLTRGTQALNMRLEELWENGD